MRAEVAKAEDAFSIGDDDKFGRIRPVGQQFRDASAIIGANEHAAWPLEDQAEPLAGEAHRRGVDQRLDFVDVVADDAKEERLVAIMQRVERDVFFQVVGQVTQIDHEARDLLVHREHVRWQQPA